MSLLKQRNVIQNVFINNILIRMSEATKVKNFNEETENISVLNNVSYLLNEIERLNLLVQQKDSQLRKAYFQIASYQSQQQRKKQNLCLIVVLFAEIECLRNRLNQIQAQNRKEHQEQISNLKVKVKKEDPSIQFVNFNLIHQLQYLHQHFITQQTKIDDKEHFKPKTTQVVDPVDPLSHPSSSIASSKTLSSNNSIWHQFSHQYRPQHQTTSPIPQFSIPRPLYLPLKSQKQKILSLKFFEKISESKNIDSSESSIKSEKQVTFGVNSDLKGNQDLQNSSLAHSRNFSFLEYRQKVPLASSINFSAYNKSQKSQKSSHSRKSSERKMKKQLQ